MTREIFLLTLLSLAQFWMSLASSEDAKPDCRYKCGYFIGTLFFSMMTAWLLSRLICSWAGSMQTLLFISSFLLYLLVLIALPLHLSRMAHGWLHTLSKAGEFLWKLFGTLSFLLPSFHQEKADLPADEQIMAMIHTASQQEQIEDGQKEIIENVLDLDDTPIEEICTRRSEVVFLDEEDSMEDWQKTIHANRHTFYPIVKDSDDVTGILDTRDYFRLEDTSRESVLKNAVDKPLFVYENTKADDMFLQMKENRNYFAVVLDEYGGVTGIVTLHDIVESLLGEMQDADEEQEPELITRLPGNRWKIHGQALLEDVEEALQIHLDTEDYDTFGGYVLGTYGKIPEDGLMKLHVDLKEADVLVREVKGHRVGICIVEKKEKEEEDERVKRSH